MKEQNRVKSGWKEQMLIEQVAKCLKYFFRYSGLAGIIYIWYLMLMWADEYTVADMALRYVNTLPISQGVAYLIGLVGLLFGLMQYRLYKRKITHLSIRLHDLEQELEKKRNSEQEIPRV